MYLSTEQGRKTVNEGKGAIGIEFGSTRIKTVLIDESYAPIASGSHEWVNKYENGIWTYSDTDIWNGLQDSFAKMAGEVKSKYGITLKKVKAIGFSAMMHGYMVFDKNDKQLVPFRTWRNTITQQASKELTGLFNFHIPQRWSIAHLYQAILNKEEHVKDIAYLTTLAGYVHWKLTGRKAVGIGEASGIFPLENDAPIYNTKMAALFENKIAPNKLPWKLPDILPEIMTAGQNAGYLTEEGAKLLDTSGNLSAGIPLCPPEGDAETGMTATNSVSPKTGNVSAGTSVFAMIVLDKNLEGVYPEIDTVTTPTGKPVAMVHCNTCTTDINAWVSIFSELAKLLNADVDKSNLYNLLFNKALEGDADCGNLMAFNFYSGEHIIGLTEGRPLFVHSPESEFNLANFMRANLYSSLCVLKMGLDILFKKENVKIDRVFGHGGFFKNKNVAQKIMAAAIDTPVTVLDTAGEGGAWGIALLAAYMTDGNGTTLEKFLSDKIFSGKIEKTVLPKREDVIGFEKFLDRYKKCLPIEKSAIEYFE